MKIEKNKVSVNVSVDKALLEKARNMVYWMPGLAFSAYVEDLIYKDVALYEDKNGSIDKPN